MILFQSGDFVLHSGASSGFKIDCDALTDDDWETLARIVAGRTKFGAVYGVPSGGERFADALQKYIDPSESTTLLVDDVLTTGASMEAARKLTPGVVLGVVVFARGACPPWIWPIFTMGITPPSQG